MTIFPFPGFRSVWTAAPEVLLSTTDPGVWGGYFADRDRKVADPDIIGISRLGR
jgi:hypothetical protein